MLEADASLATKDVAARIAQLVRAETMHRASPPRVGSVQGLSPEGTVFVADVPVVSTALASSALGTPTCVAFHPTGGVLVGLSTGQALLASRSAYIRGNAPDHAPGGEVRDRPLPYPEATLSRSHLSEIIPLRLTAFCWKIIRYDDYLSFFFSISDQISGCHHPSEQLKTPQP